MSEGANQSGMFAHKHKHATSLMSPWFTNHLLACGAIVLECMQALAKFGGFSLLALS